MKISKPQQRNQFLLIRGMLLTKEDIDSLNDAHESLPPQVLRKMAVAKSKVETYVIPTGKYQTVYATSDIHADLPKLMTLLTLNGLISKTDHIADTEWLPENTLLVLVGDIVDGRRPGRAEVNDEIGNIELLLHAFLFNLRIKARQRNSEVRFVLGNHDYLTVICDTGDNIIQHTQIHGMYRDYVHQKAHRFFNYSRENRRKCLLPFYQCCPYIFTTVGDELAFVHGGLWAYSQEEDMELDSKAAANFLQQQIELKYDILSLNTPERKVYLIQGGKSLLETRSYAQEPMDLVCSRVGKKGNGYDLTIVGHCPTHSGIKAGSQCELIHQEQPYKSEKCLEGGCVLLGCSDKDGGPELAYVDIMMSSAFNHKKPWSIQRYELLKLTHDSALKSDRYYNHITRESTRFANKGFRNTNNIQDTSIVRKSIMVWSAPKTVGGTRKRKVTRRKKGTRRNHQLLKGGASIYGYIDYPRTTINRFAKYWWEILRMCTWWSSGQDGYYFTNTKHGYMSPTHTHVYKIEDLDKMRDGMKMVYYSTKKDNKQVSSSSFIAQYRDIADKIIEINEQLGA